MTEPEPSDEALVAAYVSGGQAAFDELVKRYRRRVFAICYRYFGNAADAEDAAQEAFVAVLRRADSFDHRAAFSTWMYRVAVNACNDLARKRSRRPQAAVTEVAELADQATEQDALALRELALDLRQGLATLDPELRAAVVHHDVHGLPYADIADRLGLPVGTVKSRIHRAHARLAAALSHLREPARPPRPPTAQQ